MNNVFDLLDTRPCLAFPDSNFYLENKTIRFIIKFVIFVKQTQKKLVSSIYLHDVGDNVINLKKRAMITFLEILETLHGSSISVVFYLVLNFFFFGLCRYETDTCAVLYIT